MPQHHNKKDKDKGKHMVNYMEELSVTEAENLKKTNFRAVSADMHFTSKIRSGHINAEG